VIRFIDLGKQIGLGYDWPDQFAFYDTCTDSFISINGIQTFDSLDDLKEWLSGCQDKKFCDRLIGLVPHKFVDVKDDVDDDDEVKND
jgi:hypothetical protein